MIEESVLIIIVVGILIDLLSCYLSLRRNRKGYGASGISMVTLIVCYLLPLIISEKAVFTSSFWLDCLLLLCFHAVVVFLIPTLDRRSLARSK